MTIREIVDLIMEYTKKPSSMSDDDLICFIRNWGPFNIPDCPVNEKKIIDKIDSLIKKNMYLEEYLIMDFEDACEHCLGYCLEDDCDYSHDIQGLHKFWKNLKIESGTYKPITNQSKYRLKNKFLNGDFVDFQMSKYIKYKDIGYFHYINMKEENAIRYFSKVYDNGTKISTYDELVKAVKVANICDMKKYSESLKDLSDVVEDDDIELTWCQSVIKNTIACQPDQAKSMIEKPELLEEVLNKMMEEMPETKKYVIIARYRDKKTFVKIASDLNKSDKRVGQYESEALRYLRHPIRMKYLRAFFKDNFPMKYPISEWSKFADLELSVRTYNTIKKYMSVYYVHDLLRELDKSSTVKDLHKRFGTKTADEILHILHKLSLTQLLSKALQRDINANLK